MSISGTMDIGEYTDVSGIHYEDMSHLSCGAALRRLAEIKRMIGTKKPPQKPEEVDETWDDKVNYWDDVT